MKTYYLFEMPYTSSTFATNWCDQHYENGLLPIIPWAPHIISYTKDSKTDKNGWSVVTNKRR